MAEDINKIQSVPIDSVNKSVFNGSFTHKHTQKIADVVPNACVPIFPGDKFKGSVATAFNFPPLVNPAYQGFSQKAYMFRVRKGLLWHNDGIRAQLDCLKTGQSLSYVEPHVALSSGYYFGSNKYCIRFHPHVPVYGHKGQYGEIFLHKHSEDPTPDGYDVPEFSVNAFLQNHMDAFKSWWTKDSMEYYFSPFVADAQTHGVGTKNPLQFAPVLDYHTHYNYEKGDSIGSRYGKYGYSNGWNRTIIDSSLSKGNKSFDQGAISKASMILNFYPWRDAFPAPFFNMTADDLSSGDIIASDVIISQDELLNPKAVENFAIGYVSDGVGSPSSLMEYLGLPSFNHNAYHEDLKEKVFKPWLDLCYIANSRLIADVYDLEKDYDANAGEQSTASLDADFNYDFALILDSCGSINKTCWDVKLRDSATLKVDNANTGFKLPLFDSQSQGFDPSIHGASQWYDSTLYDYFQQYAIWCIENGYGDGTIPNDEDCPPIYIRNLANIFVAPVVPHGESVSDGQDYPCQSLCPWLAYWHVYENYFRDNNISESLKPVLSYFQNATSSRSLNMAHNLIVRSSSTDYVTWFGRDYSDFVSEHKLANLFKLPAGNFWMSVFEQYNSPSTRSNVITYAASDSTTRIQHPVSVYISANMLTAIGQDLRKCFFRLACHKELMYPFRKLLDKDLFTSILPTTSKIEVFAPSFSSSDLATFYSDKDMFVALDEELARKNGLPTAAAPYSVNTPTVSNFIDVDALRTAQILQRYYRDCSLVGDQINQFILMTFGERSQDFRPEIPELVFAREFPCHISEITQQSETDQLPLGTEGGKMSSSSSAMDFHIDSYGDFGYFIYLTCIYPETSANNGLNHQFDVHYNQFEQLFVPRFASLGEEALTSLQIDCLPKCKCDYRGANAITFSDSQADSSRVVGYVPRYALFKRIPSYISGRFKGDLNSWTLDRIPNPFEPRMTLSHKYLETPRDLRLFASDEEENCLGFTAFRMTFVRGVATDNYQPVI